MTSGGTTWTNTYNSDGLRTSRTNGTTTYNYYYEGSQLTEVTGGEKNIWIFYDAHRPIIIKYGDVDTYHYELNLQGDVIAILDSAGTRVVEYTYDAWGNILDISGSMKDTLGQANPLRYRGYVFDSETQLYYCQSRYYDPEIGRFLNADAFAATGQGFVGNNMFAYCGNNPVNCCDPTGCVVRGYHDDPYDQMIEEFIDWYRNVDEDEKDASGSLTLPAKIKRTIQAIGYNLEFAAGLGMGYYVETDVADLVGLGLGVHGNFVAIHVEDGDVSFGTELNSAIAASLFFHNFGISEYVYNRDFQRGSMETNYGLYGDETLTLFSVAAYLGVGFSMRIGFDLVQFIYDIDEIWKGG